MSPRKPIRVPRYLFIACHLAVHLAPTIWLSVIFYLGLQDELGGDPVQYLLDFTGIGALNLLVASLSVSLLAQHFKFAQLMKLRRPIGLYSAFYAFAHFTVYIAFELQFEFNMLVSEIIKRPYITIGFVALLILGLLSITSLSWIKKSMGRKWFSLHKLSYLAVLLAGFHYLWLIKSGWYEPVIYLVIAGILLFMKREKLRKL
ncbi:sulfoxide reductase heme-binding subunit YedZ [Glaciecola sp. MH2013]|uniref:sulfite oxidase heme-binding subunit YedZ n=1 Tax=Glaciecola sp. MH2013 TaxID=2785524 RepID=UPI0018A0EA74|nr:protein-methionine-sulfoxide reductase heme-binding subunit MsrQ [Glaciecola sp. MH2013]MBF7072903.1 sulfoxide reductase heme-binding subunit YedZ [Glaciecola sp. MH2013]